LTVVEELGGRETAGAGGRERRPAQAVVEATGAPAEVAGRSVTMQCLRISACDGGRGGAGGGGGGWRRR
jgi:hypothetical protein